MDKEKIKNIIYIVVAVLLSYLAIRFMLWALPFILVALLAYFIYEKLKTKAETGHYPDIVLGSRFLEGSSEFPVSFAKKIAWGLFRGLIYLGTHRKIADPTTGLQGLSRRVVIFYSTYNHFDDKYPDANIIMQMLLLGYRLVEVPAVMHPRVEGKSMHSGLKPVMYMCRMMFSILAVWIGIKLFKIDERVEDDEA